MSAGKFIAGFIVGGIVGAVAGVLLAPQSGEETREKIKESSQKAYQFLLIQANAPTLKSAHLIAKLTKKHVITDFLGTF